MNDPLNSVNDPIFWMHHTSMDRLWALWQEQDMKRLEGAPDVNMWMGPMARNRTIAEVYDTRNRNGRGSLCYRYDGLDAKYYMS
jgi:tyrosinase